MQYLLAFYEDPAAFTARARNDATFWGEWRDYFAALDTAGIKRGGMPLDDPDRARTVRGPGEGPTVHDGPYADAKEQLGGFVIIEVPGLDEALLWAERCPAAREGAVEVRPVLDAAGGDDLPAPPPPAGANRFLLAIYETASDFASREGAQAQRYWAGWQAYARALREAGVSFDGDALREPETATVVRVADNGRTVHDGPYAETREQLGGYMVLDVPTLDDALAWASRCPATFNGAVEVRAVLRIGASV